MVEAIKIIKLAIIVFIFCFLTGCALVPDTMDVSIWQSRIRPDNVEWESKSTEQGIGLTFSWSLK